MAVVTIRPSDLGNGQNPWPGLQEMFKRKVLEMAPAAKEFHLTNVYAVPDAPGLRLVGYWR